MFFRHPVQGLRKVLARLMAPRQATVFNPPEVWWNPSYGMSMADHRHAKLIIIGLPKSGNSWLYALLKDYLDLNPIDPVSDIGCAVLA